MEPRDLAVGLAGGRIAVGVVSLLAPGLVGRAMMGPDGDSGGTRLFLRVVGARDLAQQDHGVRPQDHGTRLADVVTWRWEMVTDTGEVAGGGLEFVVLGADGRIQTDYQFIGA